MDLNSFDELNLPGGFYLRSVRISPVEMIDPLGRPALAKSVIEGKSISILIMSLPENEISISIYHEILEALTVAHDSPPEPVMMMNEADFERTAHEAHKNFGFATPSSVLLFLREYGFND